MAAFIFNTPLPDRARISNQLYDDETLKALFSSRSSVTSRSSRTSNVGRSKSQSRTPSIVDEKSMGQAKSRKPTFGKITDEPSETMIEFTSYEELSRQLKASVDMESFGDLQKPVTEAKAAKTEASQSIVEVGGEYTIAKKGKVMKIINSFKVKIKKSQAEELSEAYDVLADVNTGMIHTDDLATILRAFGSEPKQGEEEEILEALEISYPGYLSLNDVTEVFKYKLASTDETREMERTFRQMDMSSKGWLTVSDLKHVAKLVQYDITDEQLHEMIAAADDSKSGKVGLESFIKFMTKKEYYDF